MIFGHVSDQVVSLCWRCILKYQGCKLQMCFGMVILMQIVKRVVPFDLLGHVGMLGLMGRHVNSEDLGSELSIKQQDQDPIHAYLV